MLNIRLEPLHTPCFEFCKVLLRPRCCFEHPIMRIIISLKSDLRNDSIRPKTTLTKYHWRGKRSKDICMKPMTPNSGAEHHCLFSPALPSHDCCHKRTLY